MTRLHRFIGNFDFSEHIIEIGDPRTVKQIARVLRLKAGDIVIVGDGKGKEHKALIKKVDQYKVYLLLRREDDAAPSLDREEAILYSAILKKENFEVIVQKATEIGITRIVPVLTERTIKKDVRRARLEDIAREAAEQSGQRFVPTIRDPISFTQALEEITEGDDTFFFDPTGVPFKRPVKEKSSPTRIFIGPEGGWSAKELEEAKSHGCNVYSLGKHILRGETAAIVATYLVLHSST